MYTTLPPSGWILEPQFMRIFDTWTCLGVANRLNGIVGDSSPRPHVRGLIHTEATSNGRPTSGRLSLTLVTSR